MGQSWSWVLSVYPLRLRYHFVTNKKVLFSRIIIFEIYRNLTHFSLAVLLYQPLKTKQPMKFRNLQKTLHLGPQRGLYVRDASNFSPSNFN